MSRFVMIQCDQRIGVSRQCANTLVFEDTEEEAEYLETYEWKAHPTGAYYCPKHPDAWGKNSGVLSR